MNWNTTESLKLILLGILLVLLLPRLEFLKIKPICYQHSVVSFRFALPMKKFHIKMSKIIIYQKMTIRIIYLNGHTDPMVI